MIKAKGLNEGNFVIYNGVIMSVSEKRSPKPFKDKKYSDKYIIELFDGHGLINCTLDEIEPIPLTKDILLKLEKIEKKADGLFVLKLHFDYEIRIIEGKKGYTFWVQNSLISANIDYLHQLQNLYFALTNQELKKIEK
jgi:hypothetical protein